MVGFTVFDSPAKRKPEEDPEKAKLDDSVHEEEKDQVGLALSNFFTLPFWVHLLIIVTLYLLCPNGLKVTEEVLERVSGPRAVRVYHIKPEGAAGPATHGSLTMSESVPSSVFLPL